MRNYDTVSLLFPFSVVFKITQVLVTLMGKEHGWRSEVCMSCSA